MQDLSYGWTMRLPGVSLGDARELVTGALAREGFGVLTEIDVRATIREKLGKETRPYVILGACNPSLADRALQAELAVGLLLPCNVSLWEDEGATMVAIARPEAMFRIADNPALRPVAEEAQRRLERAFASLRPRGAGA